MIFRVATKTSNTTTGEAAWELFTGASNRCRLRELHILMTAATASEFGLAMPAVIGVTPTTPLTGYCDDDITFVSQSKTAVAWATKPTGTAQNYRQGIQLAGTIGAGVILTFGPNGIYIPASNSLVLFNLSTTGAARVTAVFDE